MAINAWNNSIKDAAAAKVNPALLFLCTVIYIIFKFIGPNGIDASKLTKKVTKKTKVYLKDMNLKYEQR